MKENGKTYLFETMPIPRAIMELALPMVVTSLVMVIYNLADTFFVGMLNDPVQNAAVTLVYPVMLAFNAVNNLFGVGTSSMMSRCLGRGDHEMVRASSAFGFYGSVFSGLLFTVLSIAFRTPLMNLLGADEITWEATAGYLFWTVNCGAMPAILNVVQGMMVRSEGSSVHASIGTMSGCLLNIVLDPIFILPWGLGMGAAGAGLATFISNCVACLYFLVLARVKRGSTFVCLDIRKLRHLDRDVVPGILCVGVPAAIQNLLNVTGITILNNFTAVYGAAAVAAMGVAQKINMLPLQVSLGFSQGIMPLVSYNYASGNHSRMKKGFYFSYAVIMPVMLAVTLGYWLGAPWLVQMFMKNPEIVESGAAFLRGLCLAQVFLCTDFMVVGVFASLGMGKYSLLFAILRKVALEIPLLFILNALFPLYGLAYAQFVAEFLLAILALIMLRRIFRREAEKREAVKA